MAITNWNITNYILNQGSTSCFRHDIKNYVCAIAFDLNGSELIHHTIPRLKNISPMFLHWFSGFVDGEGVFSI